MQSSTAASTSSPAPTNIVRIIGAASLGTMIEWYDFYLFGSLTAIIASKFFTTTDPNKDILLWLAVFATGFLVRPFCALVFCRLGDIIGRKYTLLITMNILRLGNALIGPLPTPSNVR